MLKQNRLRTSEACDISKHIKQLLAAVMAERSDGECRMKNMNEESERREGGCAGETSISYKSFNM